MEITTRVSFDIERECMYIAEKLPLPFRGVNDLYMDLKPLFAADPMLLHVFIAMCPKEDYLSLFKKIPTYLSLTWASHLPKFVGYVNREDVSCFSISVSYIVITCVFQRILYLQRC